MAHLKLSEAFLCLDCDTIGNHPENCVVCTSRAVHPLASFLNRAERATEAHVNLTVRNLMMLNGFDETAGDLPFYMEPQIEDGRG